MNHWFIDVFLHPGEVQFGDEHTRIRTLLGSCVAVTWWQPKDKTGCMCHYLLPQRLEGNRPSARHPLDARYAEEAFTIVYDHIKATGHHPKSYQVKLFGGSYQLINDAQPLSNTGNNNIEFGLSWLKQQQFIINEQHIAGHGYRNIIFDISNGQVSVKFQSYIRLNS